LAVHERRFDSLGGICCPFPHDAQASHEVDFALELSGERGYDQWRESLYQEHVEEGARWWRDRRVQVAEHLTDAPWTWLGDDAWREARIEDERSEPDIDPGPFQGQRTASPERPAASADPALKWVVR
jgi:hypothetical protein